MLEIRKDGITSNEQWTSTQPLSEGKRGLLALTVGDYTMSYSVVPLLVTMTAISYTNYWPIT